MGNYFLDIQYTFFLTCHEEKKTCESTQVDRSNLNSVTWSMNEMDANGTLILDGYSELGAHLWSHLGYLTCLTLIVSGGLFTPCDGCARVRIMIKLL